MGSRSRSSSTGSRGTTAERRALSTPGAGRRILDPEWDIEILEMPLAEAFGMIAAGKIMDGKTIMLLQWAKMNIFG